VRKAKGKDAQDVNLEEFKVLVKNLIPMTKEQIRWIWGEVERLTYEHPELEKKINEWSTMPDLEREALEKMLDYVKRYHLKDSSRGLYER